MWPATRRAQKTNADVDDGGTRCIVPAPRGPLLLPTTFILNGATTLIFVVDGANAVCLFVMRSIISWNVLVPLNYTTWRTNYDVSVWELVDKILQFIPNRSNHLDLIVDGASAVSSFVTRSTIPWKMAVPPDGTTLAHTSLWMSTSHFMLFWAEVLWILGNGWNNTSTQRKRSAPTVLMFPSGSSQVSSLIISAVDLRSVS